MFQRTEELLTSIEAYVQPQAITSRTQLLPESSEAEIAIAAVRAAALYDFHDCIKSTLENRYFETIEKRESLARDYRAAGEDLRTIEEALSLKDMASRKSETILPEKVSGGVDQTTYTRVLERHGWTKRQTTHSWQEIIHLVRVNSEFDPAQFASLPEGVRLPEEQLSLLINEPTGVKAQITIDSSAFTVISEFFRSFGDHYTDRIKAIQAIMPHAQASVKYHFFMMWDDFAQHCQNEVDLDIVDIQS